MRVRLRFLCVDLPDLTGSREIDISGGATVEQALVEFAKIHDMEDTLNKLPESMFLIGKHTARLDTELQDKDELTVLRILHGG